jgi:hypothetical protein
VNIRSFRETRRWSLFLIKGHSLLLIVASYILHNCTVHEHIIHVFNNKQPGTVLNKFINAVIANSINRSAGISETLSTMGYSHLFRKTKKQKVLPVLQMLGPIHQKLRSRHALLFH